MIDHGSETDQTVNEDISALEEVNLAVHQAGAVEEIVLTLEETEDLQEAQIEVIQNHQEVTPNHQEVTPNHQEIILNHLDSIQEGEMIEDILSHQDVLNHLEEMIEVTTSLGDDRDIQNRLLMMCSSI